MNTYFLAWYELITALVSCSICSGQGFEVSNFHPPSQVNAPVFDSQGTPLAGTNYLAELYGGVLPSSLFPARDITQTDRRLILPFLSAGYFGTGAEAAVIPGVTSGYVWLQIRAWNARLGATYEEASARGLGGYGESPLFYLYQIGPSPNGTLPTPLLDLQSFCLRPLTPAVLMRSIRPQGNQIVVEWNPGFPRYQLQQAASLDQPWQNVGDPTTFTTAVLPVGGPSAFFRMIGFLQ